MNSKFGVRIAAWVLTSIVLVLFLYRSVPAVRFPYEIKYGEAVVVDQSRRVFEDPGLYPPFESEPFLIGNYPPVYPTVLALLPNVDGRAFTMGRAVSAVAILVSAILVGWIVRREVLRQSVSSDGDAGDASPGADIAGLLAGAFFLALPEIEDFGVLARVDSLGLAFALGGFLLVRYAKPEDRVRAVAGAALFFLAIYTRHSLIGLPAVCYSLRLIETRGRAWVEPASLLAAGIFAFLVGYFVTDGQLYDHLIFLNQLPYESSDVAKKWFAAMFPWRTALFALTLLPFVATTARDWKTFSRGLPSVVHVAAIGVILGSYGALLFDWGAGVAGERTYERYEWHLLAIGVAWFSAVGVQAAAALVAGTNRLGALCLLVGGGTALFIGRAGSDVNYLFEFYALLAIGSSLAAWSAGPRVRAAFVAGILVVSIGGSWAYEPVRTTHPKRLQEFARRKRVFDLVARIPGRVLSEDPSIPVVLGRPLEYQPFMYARLAGENLWDPQPLIEAIERKDYALIVRVGAQPYSGFEQNSKGQRVPVFYGGVLLHPNSMPRAVQAAVFEHYDLELRHTESVTDRYANVIAVYVPKR